MSILKGSIKIKARPKLNGVILYEGPSMLDGEPIVVIATLKSSNIKTGNMVQTWIIRSDMKPQLALDTGADYSICGSCPHRQGTCYVTVWQAPSRVYDAYKAGSYPLFDPDIHAELFMGRKIRLGAYGDPAAAPFEVMQGVADLGIGHTGYTHQIMHKNFDKRFIGLCMVSADSPKQATKYQAMGAKTFRVAMAGDSLASDEAECYADSQGLQCIDCGLCEGTRQNIAITVHGASASKFKTAMIPTVQVA